ncbi:helix-turn-helix transcriptional regulator [Streptococcus sp. 121]|uniref:helix-turn-helix domain-containing protein n=1 Tax=Streptococcus sp. 121 TaxID=2797637 RepID=UPI0018F0AA4F|nr:helix-turn-helix transcriptional regulator [Streptococcus sp. 121]MBJ6745418.1 helix-turn-helix transcriptional regulator [Streptococcus sp. 121]
MKIGDIVKEYRKSNKLTMQEFADKIGKTKGYISMLEKGENPQTHKPIAPTFETLKSIAEAMGIEINSLIQKLDGDQVIKVNSTRYDWDDEEENLRGWGTYDWDGNLLPSPFHEEIFIEIKNTLSSIDEVTFTRHDIETFYSSCVLEKIKIADRESLIKYLKKSIEGFNKLIHGVSDFDEGSLDSGLLSVIIRDRNKYKFYLTKLEP